MTLENIKEWALIQAEREGDDLDLAAEVLEAIESLKTALGRMYPRYMAQAAAYGSAKILHNGHLIKYMPENEVNKYDHIPEYQKAMAAAEQVKKASNETARLLRMGGEMTPGMILPPKRMKRKGYVALMKEGAVRLTSRRKAHPWKRKRSN